jgi:chorismate mutase-like protein
METSAPTLDDLRRRLDAIDDRIHELVMERAAVVEQVAMLKQSKGQPSLRPGREAEILRRLTVRHRGPFPRQSLVRLWRELLGGAVAIQGEFRVAVADGQPGLWDLARDHFGGVVAMMILPTSADVLKAIEDGRASVGVLPVPTQGHDGWWIGMAKAQGKSGLRVVARLPFAGAGNGRAGDREAFVVAAGEADTSGDDRTLLAIQTAKKVSPARLVASLDGIRSPVTHVAAQEHSAAETWHLVELDGTIAADDPRLVAALRSVGEPAPAASPLGGYARQLQRENK